MNSLSAPTYLVRVFFFIARLHYAPYFDYCFPWGRFESVSALPTSN